MVHHECVSLSLEGAVRGRHSGVIGEGRRVQQEGGVDHRGKGEILEEGDNEMGEGMLRINQ